MGPISNAALRLTFAFKDGVIQLVSQTPVRMIVPPSDPLQKTPEYGFWAELRSADDRTLFRRVLHNPIPQDMEVFSDEPSRSVSRAPGGPSEGAFSIVVPQESHATAVTLFSSHHEKAAPPPTLPPGLAPLLPAVAVRARPVERGMPEAREIGRFALKQQP